MTIAFTGHRDRRCDEALLCALAAEFPRAVWVHGGARGFDEQVRAYAERHGISADERRPNYAAYPPKAAPLIRNREIVDQADLLIACYDGRERGGTYYTIRYARERGVEVRIWEPVL